MLKKSLVLLITLGMLLTLFAGCGSTDKDTPGTAATESVTSSKDVTESKDATAPSDSSAKKVVKIGIPMDVASIAPFGSMDGGRAQMLHMMYEPLIQRIKFGAPVAEMELVCAKSITTEDSVTYDIELYDYIKDAAGNHIMASDYVWAVEEMMAEGYYPKLNGSIASITATGDYTLTVVMNNPSLGTAEWVFSIVPVISKAAYEASGDGMLNKPVTTAIYQLESFTSGSGAVLVKNEDYWQTDESLRYAWAVANADEIDFKIIKESAQMAIALKTGEIDVAGMDASLLGDFYDPATKESKDGYVVNEALQTMVIGIVFNGTPGTITDNLDLRQAVCYAINKEDIVALASSGLGQPLNAFANPWAADYNAAWDTRDYYNYDTAKSEAKLADAGYGANDVTLRLLTLDNEQYIKASQVIQANLEAVGIKVEIATVAGAAYESSSADPTLWDIQIVGRGCDDFATFPWSLLFNQGTFAWEGTYNFIVNDEMQTLYKAATGLTSHTQDTVNAFEAFLDDNAWAFGLYTNYNYVVGNTNVVSDLFMREGGECIVGGCTLK